MLGADFLEGREMAFAKLTDVLAPADAGGYAVGAFNANNMEIIQAIIEAAQEERSPVILQASQGAIKYAGIEFITGMVRIAAENATVPVVLHLDHGTGFEQLMQCIRHGFSSIMVDGSKHALEENIALTRKVIEIARAVGVSVEAEIGKIGGVEDDIFVHDADACYTDPAEAKLFYEATGVDALAIAIGTAHGQYKGTPKLDYERLSKIKAMLPNLPIVLHGSSGVPDDAIREAVKRGVRKINIDTNLREAFVGGMREVIVAHPDEIDPRKVLGRGKEIMKEVVREKMRLFGSSGKA